MQRWGADYREDATDPRMTLPGQNAPAQGQTSGGGKYRAPGTPPPTAAGQGGLPAGVDQAWWNRVQKTLGDKAGTADKLNDPQHRAWLNKQLKKKRQKKVGSGPQAGGPEPSTMQTGGPDPMPGTPPGGQTGGPEPMPGGPPGGPPPPAPGVPGQIMTGWGGRTVQRHTGGQYTPMPGAAGYPGSPSYPMPGQTSPLPGMPGGPTGPGPWGSGYGYGGQQPWQNYPGYGGNEPSYPMPGGGPAYPGYGGHQPSYPMPPAGRGYNRTPPGPMLPGGRRPEWGPGQVDPRMAYDAQTRRTV